MSRSKVIIIITLSLLLCATMALAGDFDWMQQLNITAQADPSGFRARLATRFNVGDARISAVIGNVGNPADAYMVFRLGEMAHKNPEYVLDRYQSGKKKGWGAFAKSIGIKPGSQEFHALKKGHDLDSPGDGKGKGKGKGKNKDKKKGKD